MLGVFGVFECYDQQLDLTSLFAVILESLLSIVKYLVCFSVLLEGGGVSAIGVRDYHHSNKANPTTQCNNCLAN